MITLRLFSSRKRRLPALVKKRKKIPLKIGINFLKTADIKAVSFSAVSEMPDKSLNLQ